MNLTLKDLFQAVFETVQDARRGARMIMAIQLERRQRWELLLLIAVLQRIHGRAVVAYWRW